MATEDGDEPTTAEAPEQEQPQSQAEFLEPRVLGLACELLGRHAATVPAMTAEALTALVRTDSIDWSILFERHACLKSRSIPHH